MRIITNSFIILLGAALYSGAFILFLIMVYAGINSFLNKVADAIHYFFCKDKNAA